NIADEVFAKYWKKGRQFHAMASEWNSYQQQLAQLADKVVTVTHQARQFFINTLNIPSAKIQTIYNGIDLPSKTQADKSALRKIYGFKEHDKIVVFTGRVKEEK